ncbi:DoxX family membrane protein [Legionella cardiaca]|uniref:DoxX family membrane protein n=1 Tax=Legionella cardiaca TaxID=1071983 RepID=A0ABY8AWY0_9GAMM|nr:DoxX family membrane protein [Legionella cardiaca]WED44244.1 DoxX family membrane protein [Legionella cardiaca]
MRKFILLMYLLFFCSYSKAHEQWLLTTQEMSKLSKVSPPLIFTQLTVFNGIILSLALLSLLSWVFITNKIESERLSPSQNQINWALLLVRIGTGLMLILCTLGLLPKINVPLFKEPTLFAPDILIKTLPDFWYWLIWLQLGLGILLCIGICIRLTALVLLIMLLLTLVLVGYPLLHYSGFYLGITLFLISNGGGDFSLYSNKRSYIHPISLLILQCTTGINFIFSALSIKLATPMVDIFLLEKTNAFTFNIPADYFVFLMLVVEISFGLLFILGRKLSLISFFMLILFLLLSINLSENILAHSFIYGILGVFMLLNGYPLFSRDNNLIN